MFLGIYLIIINIFIFLRNTIYNRRFLKVTFIGKGDRYKRLVSAISNKAKDLVGDIIIKRIKANIVFSNTNFIKIKEIRIK